MKISVILTFSLFFISCVDENQLTLDKKIKNQNSTTSGTIDPNGTVATCPGGPTVLTTNMNARYVIGQADFITSSADRGGVRDDDTLNTPRSITEKNGKVYIADGANNRVLVYNTRPQTDGLGADLVVGQSDFLSNANITAGNRFQGVQGISSDNTHLYISQWTSSRVSAIPLNTLDTGVAHLGQPNENASTANNGGISASAINASAGNIVYGDKVIVVDATNNRVLIYNKDNLANGLAADTVIGQANFTANGSGSNPDQLNFPLGVAYDGTYLAITSSDRVHIYNSLPTVNGASADVVLGSYGNGANQMDSPVGVYIRDNKLYVSDRGNDRVMVWNSIPTIGNENADVIIGQAGPGAGDHNQCNCSTPGANTLWGVHNVYHDGCRLIVADTQNNRVLIY
jgi:hypothetical protein